MESQDVAKLGPVSVGRRTFIIVGGASVIGAGTYAWLRRMGYQVDPAIDPRRDGRAKVGPLPYEPFDPTALATLGALVDHLLPGDPSRNLPSGRDAGVLDYLVAAARAPGMGALRDEVLKLTRHLDLLAKKRAGATFAELVASAAANEEARPKFDPARALEATLRLSLEGYLGHPHWGGNRETSVWSALSVPMPREREPRHGHGG
jgi:hypothetical protein